jgi:hypothetical protein
MTSQTENLCAFALASIVVTALTLGIDSFTADRALNKGKVFTRNLQSELVLGDQSAPQNQDFKDIKALLKTLEGGE